MFTRVCGFSDWNDLQVEDDDMTEGEAVGGKF